VSRTPDPDGDRGENYIEHLPSAIGVMVQHGYITIYPPGARSFKSVFEVMGHEIGHFFWDRELSEPELDDYGKALWRVYNGGEYTGPEP
jgi:hypothetical protein